MLKRDRDRQHTNGAESANRVMRDGSFAVTPRQSWKGTGFAMRGRGNRGRQEIEGGFRCNNPVHGRQTTSRASVLRGAKSKCC